MTCTRRQLAGFLSPWAVGFLGLTLGPLAVALAFSFCGDTSRLRAPWGAWTGTENYRRALDVDRHSGLSQDEAWYEPLVGGRPRDARSWKAMSNSLVYAAIATPLTVALALGLAVLLARVRYGAHFASALLYLPYVLGGVASLVIWSWLLNPQYGLVNQVIRGAYAAMDPVAVWMFDLSTAQWTVPDWLYSPSGAKPAVILMHLWSAGGPALILLAGIRRIPRFLHEAAILDGASSCRRFVHVTFPLLTPVVFFSLICSFVFCIQSFNESYVLRNRQQGDSLLFYAVHLYETAFQPPYRLAYASALACILILVLLLILTPVFATAKWWVFYEGQHRGE